MTLTEVLVVLAIIAILVAALLPGIEARKRIPQKITCISNVNQICISMKVWEGDNDDKFPVAFVATNSSAIKLVADGKNY